MTKDKARVVITAIQHAVDMACGSSHLAHDEAKHLASAGNEVWLVGPMILPNTPECECRDGVNLLRYRVPQFAAGDPRRAWAHQWATKAVLRRFVGGYVDVVHGHVPLSYEAACDLYGGRARTCYTAHSPVAKEMELTWQRNGVVGWASHHIGLPWLNRLERRCLRQSCHVTVFSQFTKDLLTEVHGQGFARKIAIVPGWVDLEHYKIVGDRRAAKVALGWPADVPVLFTLRRLVPRMGLDRLLRATRRLFDRGMDFHLVIGGSGPLRASLERLAQQLELSAKVTFAGYIPNSQLPLMYAACDAFVLPTAALECFGLIVIEALACGRPVLASPVAAIPEILNLIEPKWMAKSPEEEAIAELIGDFLRGKLPVHAPDELRSVVAQHYESRARIEALTKLLLN